MSKVIWFTGMSGVGKTTILKHGMDYVNTKGFTSNSIDGDDIRNKYKIPIGFSYDEICTNNKRIAELCNKIYKNYDFLFVAVISPYEKIRNEIKEILNNNIYFIYVHADIDDLKLRDEKGLYKKADEGLIDNLIGYSKDSPYESPLSPDLKIDTSMKNSIDNSKRKIEEFINKLI